jgi:hypothetical protein
VYFATLFINPIVYVVTETMPASGFKSVYTWEEDGTGSKGSREGWTLSSGGGEELREIVFYFLGFAQKPND